MAAHVAVDGRRVQPRCVVRWGLVIAAAIHILASFVRPRVPRGYGWRFFAIVSIWAMAFLLIGIAIREYGQVPIPRRQRIIACIAFVVLAALMFWLAPILDHANPPHSWSPPR